MNFYVLRDQISGTAISLEFVPSIFAYLSYFMHTFHKERAKEQILDELCIMPQVILFATDRNENLKRDRKW